MKLCMCAALCGGVILVACSSPATAKSARENAGPAGRAAPARETDGDAITGTASMYNPFKPGYESGGPETASGERYDPAAWTAAIKTGLRHMFSGVRYGSEYRPAYALVEAAGKRAVVRINDVGPLMPGRVIDFNERTMRYFDPSLERGLIRSVTVTPLDGEGWSTGPVGG
jgi:rare lipoprotein A